jgi:hypothetical protein
MANGLTTTELRHSPAELLLSDCATSPIPIRAYKKHIATLSLYDPSKKHTHSIKLINLRDLDVYEYSGATLRITYRNKPLLTLEFMK